MMCYQVFAVSVVLFSSVYGFNPSYYGKSLRRNPLNGNMLKTATINYFAGDSDGNNFRSDKSDLIFPGTKWCGAGDIATDYNDLGTNIETDKCCRDHDHCSDYILAKSTSHGLTNNAPYTRVHCNCDQKFYDCLKVSADKGDQSSQMIGYMYFHMLETQCFKEDYPIINCTKYPDSKRCALYNQDTSAAKIWQWFDVPYFYM